MTIAVGSDQTLLEKSRRAVGYAFHAVFIELGNNIVAKQLYILTGDDAVSMLIKFVHEQRQDGRVNEAGMVGIYLLEHGLGRSSVYQFGTRPAYHLPPLLMAKRFQTITVSLQARYGSAVLLQKIKIVFAQTDDNAEIAIVCRCGSIVEHGSQLREKILHIVPVIFVSQSENLLKLVEYQHRIFAYTALSVFEDISVQQFAQRSRLPDSCPGNLSPGILSSLTHLAPYLAEITLFRIMLQTYIDWDKVFIAQARKDTSLKQRRLAYAGTPVNDCLQVIENNVSHLAAFLVPSKKAIALSISV